MQKKFTRKVFKNIPEIILEFIQKNFAYIFVHDFLEHIEKLGTLGQKVLSGLPNCKGGQLFTHCFYSSLLKVLNYDTISKDTLEVVADD